MSTRYLISLCLIWFGALQSPWAFPWFFTVQMRHCFWSLLMIDSCPIPSLSRIEWCLNHILAPTPPSQSKKHCQSRPESLICCQLTSCQCFGVSDWLVLQNLGFWYRYFWQRRPFTVLWLGEIVIPLFLNLLFNEQHPCRALQLPFWLVQRLLLLLKF